MNRQPGDWNCKSCHQLNFSWRDSCYRCGMPKIGGGSEYAGVCGGGIDAKPGDWYCICGTHNFACRSNCYTCGTCKSSCVPGFDQLQGVGAYGGMRAGWKSGDWICTMPGCNEHNYASRKECHRCNTPREYLYN